MSKPFDKSLQEMITVSNTLFGQAKTQEVTVEAKGGTVSKIQSLISHLSENLSKLRPTLFSASTVDAPQSIALEKGNAMPAPPKPAPPQSTPKELSTADLEQLAKTVFDERYIASLTRGFSDSVKRAFLQRCFQQGKLSVPGISDEKNPFASFTVEGQALAAKQKLVDEFVKSKN